MRRRLASEPEGPLKGGDAFLENQLNFAAGFDEMGSEHEVRAPDEAMISRTSPGDEGRLWVVEHLKTQQHSISRIAVLAIVPMTAR